MMPSLAMFLSSDFQGDVYVTCDYCHRDVLRYDSRRMRINKDALDIHVALAHMPPSEVSKELRRNMALGHV